LLLHAIGRYAVMSTLLPILPVGLGGDAMLDPAESISVSVWGCRPPCLCGADD
jgi:hypothetical protein